ncbi:MAG: MCP four helix bundle domain-containing protein [Bdellovibrionales bacterium]|nr:MCP four helix bundle domain-containing protein [Bdellovibrionales bacterium]
MGGFKNLDINLRLVIGFAIAPIVIIALIFISISRVNSIEQSLTTINNFNSVKQRFAINFRGSVHDRAISLRDVVLNSDKNEVAKSLHEIEVLSENYKKSAAPLDNIFTSSNTNGEDLQLLNDIKEIEAKTLPLIEKTIRAKQAGQDVEAHNYLMLEAKPAFIVWLKQINKFIDYQEKLNVNEAKAASEIAKGFQKLMIILTLVSLVVVSIIGFLISNSIIKPLLLASGNLDNSSKQILQVSEIISISSKSLADGSSNQSNSLNEISAAIEQMNIVVLKNAENSTNAARISTESKLSAENGEKVVNDMIKAIDEIDVSNQTIMDQINESNKQITDIVKVIEEIGDKTKVINDIVFQTKLLSFNASVEAARAGEQGKGFAVVAEEVGKLAQLSGNAAKEISDMLLVSSNKVAGIVNETQSKVSILIKSGKGKVEAGNSIAKQCSIVLNEIVAKVHTVTEMAEEISIASTEQKEGFKLITKNVLEMDKVTRENTTLSRQTSETLKSLNLQSAELRKASSELSQMVGVKQAS